MSVFILSSTKHLTMCFSFKPTAWRQSKTSESSHIRLTFELCIYVTFFHLNPTPTPPTAPFSFIIQWDDSVICPLNSNKHILYLCIFHSRTLKPCNAKQGLSILTKSTFIRVTQKISGLAWFNLATYIYILIYFTP